MLNFFVGGKRQREPEAPARECLAGASGFLHLCNLVPWQQLEPIAAAAPGTWRATGVDPQFRAACRIPAGWIRIRLKLSCDDRARVELLVDTGTGYSAAECLERSGFRGALERDFFVNLPRPAIGFRLDPRDTEGSFRLEEFHIGPSSRLSLLGQSLWNTFATGPARIAELSWSLARGRWNQVKHLLLENLPGPSALAPPPYDPEQAYAAWRKQRQLTEADRKRMRDWIRHQQKLPFISIIVPQADHHDALLSATITSIRKQLYPNWELLIAGKEARSASKQDPAPARRAEEAFVTLLAPGDQLAENALFQVAHAIIAEPDLDMLYSDEDEIGPDGQHVNPFFKPNWSPETLQSFPYTGGLAVYRAELVRKLGFTLDERIQEYELALRIAGRSCIKHLPDVLIHRRQSPSASEGSAQTLAGAGALTAAPKVSILIPTAYQAEFLRRCLESIRQKSSYTNYEILVLDNNQPPPDVLEALRCWGIRRVPYDMPFNWARTMNQGAAMARGEHLLILDDDTEVITPDWIERLLEYSQQEEIGVVGARLQFPDGRLQHAGVTILDGVPGHPFYGYPEDHPGYFFSSVLPRNYSAVTGACLMTRADVFRSVRGFDETFGANFNDIDYCLRVGGMGLRVVCNPFARLIHHETATKTAFLPNELAAFQQRWKGFRDPYSNPSLSKRFHDFRIALKS